MSLQKAWWKKISIRGIGSALSQAGAFIGGGLAATGSGSNTPQEEAPGMDRNTMILLGVGAVLLLFLLLKKR